MAETVIAPDLKGLYRETESPRDEDILWAARVRTLIERVSKAEQENVALWARVAKLEAPVSDEEWGECDVPALAEFDALHRELANAIIAARGREGE